MLGKFAALLAKGTGKLAGAQKWTGAALRPAFSAAKFGLSHPLLIGGVVLSGVGAKAAIDHITGSPTLGGARVNTNYDQQAAAAELLGEGFVSPQGFIETAPQMTTRNARRQAELEASAAGLVQGLNRGRHG